MKYFLFLLFCLPASVFGQDTMKYETSLIDAENRWVITPMRWDSTYTFGYVFMDSHWGMKYIYSGSFMISNTGDYKVLFKMPLSLYGGDVKEFKDHKVKLMDSSQLRKLAIDPECLRPLLSERDTTSSSARLAAALSYKELGAVSKAIEILKSILAVDPEFDSCAVELAKIYNNLDRFDSTINLLQSRIYSQSKLPSVHQLYCCALLCLEKEDLAITQLVDALKICGEAEEFKFCFVDLLNFYGDRGDKQSFDAWYGLAKTFWQKDILFVRQIKRMRYRVHKQKHIRVFKGTYHSCL